MKLIRHIAILFVTTVALVNTAQAYDYYFDKTERAAQSSEQFVELFNLQEANALGRLYVRNGVLKLPDAVAVAGRQNIVNAWQGGFDAGLETLTLTSTFEQISRNRVLENGTFDLIIQTPNGPITQFGTFSVLWRVPGNPNRPAKIIFDTIDAEGVR